MRSVKTTSGLTRGKGMWEVQRLVWIMSMPICADVNNSMQTLTGFNSVTSEQHTDTIIVRKERDHSSQQHKDTTKARKERDFKETNTLIAYFAQRNPFSTNSSGLRNIATGVVAESRVNCDKSTEVGGRVVESLKGKDVAD